MVSQLQPRSLAELFVEARPLYEEFARTLAGLLGTLLGRSAVHVHSITWRTKTTDSLLHKIEANAGRYQRLSDVTDLAGVRIITYFPDEIDRVAAVVSKEFVIDWGNSVDKRLLLDPDRFGYLSLHYVGALSQQRLELAEYRRFAGCRAEFQMRSVLQHTWAEIEHDLGYKSAQAIPRDIRRRFSRLGGLLELADSEFAAIRDALVHYENTVKQQIERHPSCVQIDQVSLRVFIEMDKAAATLHDWLVRNGGSVSREPSAEFLTVLLKSLIAAGITTVQGLRRALDRQGDALMGFELCMYDGSFKGIGFYPGAPLLTLCELLAIEREGASGLEAFFQETGQSRPVWLPIEKYLSCYERNRVKP